MDEKKCGIINNVEYFFTFCVSSKAYRFKADASLSCHMDSHYVIPTN